MANDDFDFDGTFTDDEDAGFEEFDEVEDAEDEEEGEDEEKSKPNILRVILLALVVLILLCAGCALIGNLGIIPIPGLGGSEPPPQPPAQETPPPAATDEASLPATEEAVPGEQPVTAEATPETPSTEQPTVVIEPSIEATEAPTEGPTVVITVETVEPTATVESTAEPTTAPTATTPPVPGPTPTSGPTVIITITPENCENNLPPIADAGGPYEAMRGKGQAIVNFDGTQSNDPDGEITGYVWNFGDSSDTAEGATVTHAYTTIGTYAATLTVTDNCGATGQDTADVTIIGATPPATGTPGTPTPEPPVVTSTPDASVTMGFCYRVQYGDTLSGVAWKFGINWQDLAMVNQVPMGYFVIAGQGLFIPTGSIGQGPNVYQTQPGDTLNGVAYNCGLATTTLAQANGLSPTDSLTPGQQLVIPVWKP